MSFDPWIERLQPWEKEPLPEHEHSSEYWEPPEDGQNPAWLYEEEK